MKQINFASWQALTTRLRSTQKMIRKDPLYTLLKIGPLAQN